MKLTKAMREKFVDDVLAGIPIQHGYDLSEAKEQIRALYESQLPSDILTFAKKYPNLIKRDKYFNLKALAYLSKDRYERQPSVWVIDYENYIEADLSQWVKFKHLADAELEERKSLRNRLLEIANACTTLAKLKVALPELESYMPVEQEVKRNLPVASGTVITDLLQLGLKIAK